MRIPSSYFIQLRYSVESERSWENPQRARLIRVAVKLITQPTRTPLDDGRRDLLSGATRNEIGNVLLPIILLLVPSC